MCPFPPLLHQCVPFHPCFTNVSLSTLASPMCRTQSHSHRAGCVPLKPSALRAPRPVCPIQPSPGVSHSSPQPSQPRSHQPLLHASVPFNQCTCLCAIEPQPRRGVSHSSLECAAVGGGSMLRPSLVQVRGSLVQARGSLVQPRGRIHGSSSLAHKGSTLFKGRPRREAPPSRDGP